MGNKPSGYLPSSTVSVESQIRCVISDMRRSPNNVDDQMNGCLSLVNLMSYNFDGALAVLSQGGVECIVCAMKQHLSSEGVQRNGCLALGSVMRAKEGPSAVLSQGGVKCVILAMKQFPSSEKVQRNGCWTLGNLTVLVEGRSAVFFQGGVEYILYAMKRFPSSDVVQRYGNKALSMVQQRVAVEGPRLGSIPFDESVDGMPCSSGSNIVPPRKIPLEEPVLTVESQIRCVISDMRRSPNNVDDQMNGCLSLVNLMRDNFEGALAVLSQGSVECILQAMKHFPSSEELQHNGSAALAKLVNSEESRLAVLSQGGVECLLRAMKQHLSSEGVQCSGCEVLAKLMDSEEGLSAVLSQGGLECILLAMTQFLSSEGVQCNGKKALTAVQPQLAVEGPNTRLPPIAAPIEEIPVAYSLSLLNKPAHNDADKNKNFVDIKPVGDRLERLAIDPQWSLPLPEIPFEELKLEHVIGKGSFKDVSYATWANQEVAVSCFRYNATTNDTEEFRREIDILLCLPRHSNIIRLIGVCSKPPNLALVTEYAAGGDLKTYLYGKDDGASSRTLSLLSRLVILAGIADGISFLHSRNICHRDLKTANILLTAPPEHRPLVADFGIARTVGTCANASTARAGTYAYMAPEVMTLQDGQTYNGSTADVYSFGIVCYEVLTGAVPFSNISNPMQLLMRVGIQGERPLLPASLPTHIASLVNECWSQDESRRPSMQQVCSRLRECVEQEGASNDDVLKECIICMENARNCVFVPCCHAVTCVSCAEECVMAGIRKCPVCQQCVTRVVSVDAASIHSTYIPIR